MINQREKLTSRVIKIFSKKSIGVMLDFTSSIFLVRMLGADQYGIYITLLLFPHLISSFGSMGLGSSIIFFINKVGISTSQLSRSLLILALALGSSYAFILTSFTVSINGYVNYELPTDLIMLVSIMIPFTLLEKYFGPILIAQNNLNYHTNLLVLAPAIMRAFLLLIIFFTDIENKLAAALIIVIFTRISVALFLCFSQLLKEKFTERVRLLPFADFKKIVVFGLKSHLGGILERSNREISMIIMVGFLNSESIANYNIALRISNILLQIKAVSTMFLQQSVSKAKIEEIKSFFPLVNRMIILIFILAVPILLISSSFLLPVLYNYELESANYALNILIYGTVLLTLFGNINVLFTQTGRPLMKSKFRIFGFILNVVLLLYLLTDFGIIGAAIAYTSSYLLMYLIALFYAQRYFGFSIKDLLLIKTGDLYFLRKSIVSIITKNK